MERTDHFGDIIKIRCIGLKNNGYVLASGLLYDDTQHNGHLKNDRSEINIKNTK
jgi:hypothetical protein